MPVRTFDARDGEAFVDLMEVLDRGTRFLMVEPGERPVDLAALRERLGTHDSAVGALYESAGFELEGRHRCAVRPGDAFHAEPAYAKLLGAA